MTSLVYQNYSGKTCEELWNEFLLEFPTESSCVEELFRRVFDKEFSCLFCGSTFVNRINNSRITKCYDCKTELHTLAGTFFHNIRRAQAWAGAIWLMERGIALNSCQFSRLAGIAASSAQKIFKDLSLLLLCKLDNDSVMDTYSFLQVYNRRSRVSPAGEPPQNEEISLQKDNEVVESVDDQLNFIAQVAAKNGLVINDEQWIIIKLLANRPYDEDEVSLLTGFEIGKVISHIVLFQIYDIVEPQAGRFVLKMPAMQKLIHMGDEAKQLQAEFVAYISKIFGSISRKYVQNYLGWFWSVVDRKSWPPQSMNAEIFAQGRMSPEESRDYVSPIQVKCSLCFFRSRRDSSPLALSAV